MCIALVSFCTCWLMKVGALFVNIPFGTLNLHTNERRNFASVRIYVFNRFGVNVTREHVDCENMSIVSFCRGFPSMAQGNQKPSFVVVELRYNDTCCPMVGLA